MAAQAINGDWSVAGMILATIPSNHHKMHKMGMVREVPWKVMFHVVKAGCLRFLWASDPSLHVPHSVVVQCVTASTVT